MAKCLDGLIDNILEEIANLGSGGATVSQIRDFVQTFYDGEKDKNLGTGNGIQTQNIDDLFITRVWTWLTQHPDTFLSEAGKSPKSSRVRNLKVAVRATGQSPPPRGTRIHVIEKRVYRALCGEAAERDRPFPSEYALLTRIAASGSAGITQGDLGRATNQDKRSVPKRTDALQAKGFIIKKPIIVNNGTKSSLLLLRRYAHRTGLDGSQAEAVSRHSSVREVIRRIADILSDGTLIEVGKLQDIIGDDTETGKKALIKIIRPLEKEGFLKRVKAAFGPAAQTGDLKTYVQLINQLPEQKFVNDNLGSLSLDREIGEWLEEERSQILPPKIVEGEKTLSNDDCRWDPERVVQNYLAGVSDVVPSVEKSMEVQTSPSATGPAMTFGESIRSVRAVDVLSADGKIRLAKSRKFDHTETVGDQAILEDALSPNSGSRRARRRTQHRPFSQDASDKPKGRPRRFVRGTEKFWQHQFLQAKRAEGDDGDGPSREGVMSDPAGLELFASRPDNFDETLVEANLAGLPIPANPDAVNVAWVQQTRAVLERSQSGAYITPEGTYLSRTRHLSRLLIVRTNKLNSIDCFDRSRIPDFRFITSVVAHSLHYRRFYPQIDRSYPRRRVKPGRTLAEPSTLTPDYDLKGPSRSGPPLGTFMSKAHRSETRLPSKCVSRPGPLPQSPDCAHLMDSTDSEAELSSRGLNEIPPRTPRALAGLTFATRLRDEVEDQPFAQHVSSSVTLESNPLGSPLEETQIEKYPSREPNIGTQAPVQTKPSGQLSPNHDLLSPRPSDTLKKQVQIPKESLHAQDPGTSATEQHSTARRRGRGGDPSLCQNIILELVSLVNGIAPNHRPTLQKCMTRKWQAAGKKDRPLLKPIKAATSALADAGKVNEHFFTFRGKGGVMLTRSLLYLPNISVSDSRVQSLKQTIIDADATDYVPPEWVTEIMPLPNSLESRSKRLREETPDPQPETGDCSSIVGSETVAQESLILDRPKRTPKRHKVAHISASDDDSVSLSSRESDMVDICPATGFLTLRIPRLGSLEQVQRFEAFRGAQRLIAEAEALARKTEPRQSKRRRDRRLESYDESDRRTQPDQGTDGVSRVRWLPPKKRLPDSLQQILDLAAKEGKHLDSVDDNHKTAVFDRTVDIVAAWEVREADFVLSEAAEDIFINHTVNAQESVVNPIKAWYLVSFDDDGRAQSRQLHEFPAWDIAVLALHLQNRREQKVLKSQQLAGTRPSDLLEPEIHKTRQSTGVIRKRTWSGIDDDEDPLPPTRKSRKIGTDSRHDVPMNSDADREVSFSGTGRLAPANAALPIPREYPPVLRGENLSFVIAVMCIRGLVGGIDKVVNWKCLSAVYPEKPESVLRHWWKSCSIRFAHEISRLGDEFQKIYLEGLECGAVPSVDFQNIATNDWQRIVDWARAHVKLPAPVQSEQPEARLPASRSDKLLLRDLSNTETSNFRRLLENQQSITGPAVEEVYNAAVGGTYPFVNSSKSSSTDTIEPGSLSVATSRVLAVIRTPDAKFEGEAAERLLLLEAVDQSEPLLRSAFAVLQSRKLISKRTGHEIDHGNLRQWQLSTVFKNVFVHRRSIHYIMLKKAARYKVEVLDRAFTNNEALVIAKDAGMDDGATLAILNLLGQGQIQVRFGTDVPNSRYGIGWQRVGYQTKLIDKGEVAFSTILHPTGAYESGDPRQHARKIIVPASGSGAGGGRMPLWLDKDGDALGETWEMVLAAILGVVNLRPGVGALEISYVFDGVISQGDIELVLGWCLDSGFVTKTQGGTGWETSDWWWFAIGTGIAWRSSACKVTGDGI